MSASLVRVFFLLAIVLWRPVEVAGGGKSVCRIEDIQKDGVYNVPPSCVKLALGGAKMGDNGVVALAEALERGLSGGAGATQLAELHLPTTGMGSRGAEAVASYLAHAGSANSLRVLNMYGNALGDDGAVALSRIFADNNRAGIPLDTLGLGVNNIGARGAAALAATLGPCSACPLRTLGLYRNAVGDEGAAALAATLVRPDAIPLSSLFLGGNGVRNAGAAALAAALETNTKLKVLSLEGGTVGDAGAVALGKALAGSRTLTALDIRSCLPTHRNCAHSSLSLDEVGGAEADPDKMTRTGLLALRGAVRERAAAAKGPALKVIGDIDFSS